MALGIFQACSSTGSGSSVSSQHDQSTALYLVANLPEQLICHVAVRGDRYRYILDNKKRQIVSYVGYGFLSNSFLHGCKKESLVICSFLT